MSYVFTSNTLTGALGDFGHSQRGVGAVENVSSSEFISYGGACNKSLEMIWKQCTTDRSAGWKCVQLNQK